ncbi:MAG TPA: aminoglycoside phosphotransferase family protein [Patescibacteria group bacterium]|nr:aminoglycoside phosphotransferase family protein [Patescibacteria group bacterium]
MRSDAAVADTPMPRAVPSWLAARFAPGQVRTATPLAWGFRNDTWRVDLADGRPVVACRLADPAAASRIVTLLARVADRFAAAGLPSPAIAQAGDPSDGVLVSEYVDGLPGAALLGEPGGAELIGSLLGATWLRLAAVEPDGLALDPSWTEPRGLAAGSLRRLARLGERAGDGQGDRPGDRLTHLDRTWMAAALDDLPGLLAERRPGFVHGDFVPVNVIIRERAVVAVLDFESARLADPLLDAAWFATIVAFHHPREARVAVAAFAKAAGLDLEDPPTRRLFAVLPVVRCLEILDDPRLSVTESERWLAIVRAHVARSR